MVRRKYNTAIGPYTDIVRLKKMLYERYLMEPSIDYVKVRMKEFFSSLRSGDMLLNKNHGHVSYMTFTEVMDKGFRQERPLIFRLHWYILFCSFYLHLNPLKAI